MVYRSYNNLDVLTDTKGVEFAPYLESVLWKVKQTWYTRIPQSALRPELKKGKVIVDFSILKNGQLGIIRLRESSGDDGMDKAALDAIFVSPPFKPLPSEFKGESLALRLHFLYNPSP